MSHRASFAILSPGKFFHEIVVPQRNDFLANNCSSRHAILAIVVTYHMYERVNPGESFTIDNFKAKYNNCDAIAGAFDIARMIANGAKHFKPRIQTRTQKGFSSGFSSAFARPLMIVRPDGSECSADYILQQMVEFWKKREVAGF